MHSPVRTGGFSTPAVAPPAATTRGRAQELRPRAARLKRGFTATDLDREYLAFICRFRYAGEIHLADHFGVSVGAARSKLARLTGAGALTRVPNAYRGLTLYAPTPGGLQLSGTGLGRPSGGTPGLPTGMAEATMGHTIGVLRMCSWLLKHPDLIERRAHVLSEREIRAIDMVAPGRRPPVEGPRFAVSTGSQLHFPDAVLVDKGPYGLGLWALEWESRQKSLSEIRRILKCYAWSRHLTGVMYVCSSEPIAARIRAEAVSCGLPPERLRVFGPSDHRLSAG